ncbi:MAG: hypothetical protein PHD47_00850 [Acholeplasmataceae bacterium]|nr:hypothetical protein [Acholeplasmataceae bacterium]
MKILLHVSNLNQIERMQNNINNLVKEDESIIINVVANDEAVKAFINNQPTRINPRARYFVCANSLRANSIDKRDIIIGAEVTSSGVYKIALLQEEGFQYIKV